MDEGCCGCCAGIKEAIGFGMGRWWLKWKKKATDKGKVLGSNWSEGNEITYFPFPGKIKCELLSFIFMHASSHRHAASLALIYSLSLYTYSFARDRYISMNNLPFFIPILHK